MAAQERCRIRIEDGVTARLRIFVGSFATHHGLAGDDTARAQIIVEELITNLFKYGYPDRPRGGTAEIALGLEEDRLLIEITDDGRAFNPFDAPLPDFGEPLQARPTGGMGLHIVRLLTEGKQYQRVEDRNVVQLSLRLGSTHSR